MNRITELDPKWTAYVLGELSETEAAECESELREHPELQSELDAIRHTATQLEEFMKHEALPETIAAASARPRSAAFQLFRFTGACAILFILACVIIPDFLPYTMRLISMKLEPITEYGKTKADNPPMAEMGTPELAAPGDRSVVGLSGPGAFNANLDTPAEKTVAVPDGGTILLGGVERLSEKPQADGLPHVGGFDRKEPIIEEAQATTTIQVPDGGTILGGGIRRLSEEGEPSVDHSKPTAVAEKLSENSSVQKKQTFGFSGEDSSEQTENQGFKIAAAHEALRRERERNKELEGVKFGESIGKRKQFAEIRAKKLSSEKNSELTMMVEPRILIEEGEEAPLTNEYQLSQLFEANLLERNRDSYDSSNTGRSPAITENAFLKPSEVPLSTFSIDVDTASYSAMRRTLQSGGRVDPHAVRLEEFINYFKYTYPQPEGDKPFATNVELGTCPWESKHLLAKIGLKGKEIVREERPALNLVFLIDVSGSMSGSNRLPLVKRGLTELVEMLEEKDRVAIVTYAGSSNVALPSVSGRETRAILDSIEKLNAGGSTAGAAGIQNAYEVARKSFTKEGQNRVILCTDGDFNVGITDNAQLETLIQSEAKSGVFLTVLGFGMGNYRDDKLKTLSSKGNGNYGYIDTIDEARKMLVDDLTGTLVTIAKDVKIQVDFNPARVAAYRLLGYEYRLLAARDFHDDRKDAGDIGAGHTVTALYEIVPAGEPIPGEDRVDESRYAATETVTEKEPVTETENLFKDELMFVKLRYKLPEQSESVLENFPVLYGGEQVVENSPEFNFASSVALYGMLLRGSRYSGSGNFDTVLELAAPAATGPDAKARQEFLDLVRTAKERNPDL